jgi:hypothetical protein
MLYIFLDDIRMPPDDCWLAVRTADAAYELIRNAFGQEMTISLDHDLGENIPTGYDLLNWLENDIARNPDFRPRITFQIHSANPVGRANMERAITSIERWFVD